MVCAHDQSHAGCARTTHEFVNVGLDMGGLEDENDAIHVGIYRSMLEGREGHAATHHQYSRLFCSRWHARSNPLVLRPFVGEPTLTQTIVPGMYITKAETNRISAVVCLVCDAAKPTRVLAINTYMSVHSSTTTYYKRLVFQ